MDGNVLPQLLEISLELAAQDKVYEDMATTFFEHFVCIADAINNVTGSSEGLWDKENGFYYGLLRTPQGKFWRMYQDNCTGIVPLFAIATMTCSIRAKHFLITGSASYGLSNIGAKCCIRLLILNRKARKNESSYLLRISQNCPKC